MVKTALIIAIMISSVLSTQKFVTYIDKINQWWPPAAIAKGMGVPGYTDNDQYNVINLAFVLAEK